jgi:hypothetical protein
MFSILAWVISIRSNGSRSGYRVSAEQLLNPAVGLLQIAGQSVGDVRGLDSEDLQTSSPNAIPVRRIFCPIDSGISRG